MLISSFQPWKSPSEIYHLNGEWATPTARMDAFVNVATQVVTGGAGNGLKTGLGVAGPMAQVARAASSQAFKHSFKYHPRIRIRALQDPVAHNFPYSFDDIILKVKSIKQADGSFLYRKAGTLNGKEGFFEIGLNLETKTIFHRTFTGGK